MKGDKFWHLLIVVFTYLVLLKPYYLTEISLPIIGITINQIFAILQLIILLFFFVAKLKSCKINKIDILLLFIVLVAIISNVQNGHSIYFVLSNYINLVLTYMFFNYELKKDLKGFLKISSVMMCLLLFINLISIFLKPVDYYLILTRVHFLGYDNDVVPIIFSFVLIFLLNIYLENGFKNTCILGVILGILNLILIWSANGIVGLFLMMLYLLFFKNKKTNNIYNYNTVFYISIVVFALIVLFRFQNYFEYIIVDLLGRDLTFTGRTLIWDRAINIWNEHKLLGLGVFDFKQRRLLYGVYHAHCTYLNILFETGLIGLFLRFYFLKSLNDKIKNYKTRISGLIVFFFIIYFTITLIEVYVNDFLFYTLIGLILNINILHEGGANYDS